MKKNILTAIILLIISSIGCAISGECGRREIITRTFYSPNKIYSMQVKDTNYSTDSPSEYILKKGEEIIWTKNLPNSPRSVSVSDNGKYFVSVNWARNLEVKSLSFYNGNGHLLKNIEFPQPKFGGATPSISSDGSYYIIKFINVGESAEAWYYFVPEQKMKWEKTTSSKTKVEGEYIVLVPFEYRSAILSDTGEYILLDSFDNRTGKMIHRFTYLDKEGKTLWEKDVENGFTYNKLLYSMELSDDGLSFKIIDLTQNTWQEYKNINGKIELIE